jgi:GMP synthase (glutamine-hydrolysing)
MDLTIYKYNEHNKPPMKKLLIIKTGTTCGVIRRQAGDFEDMIIDRCQIPISRTATCEVFKRQRLPEISDFFAVIITGSHAMVTDNPRWSIYLAQWLKEKAIGVVPILGICFGHQLIAHCSGGKVAYHPQGKELGTVMIRLTDEGQSDALLKVLPTEFPAHVAHSQTVIDLPYKARLLAGNTFEPHHAFSIGRFTWGVQFHPEFTADIIRLYVKLQEKQLLKNGYDAGAVLNSIKDNPFGERVLKRFLEIAEEI